jgi:hypothetical protein
VGGWPAHARTGQARRNVTQRQRHATEGRVARKGQAQRVEASGRGCVAVPYHRAERSVKLQGCSRTRTHTHTHTHTHSYTCTHTCKDKYKSNRRTKARPRADTGTYNDAHGFEDTHVRRPRPQRLAKPPATAMMSVTADPR